MAALASIDHGAVYLANAPTIGITEIQDRFIEVLSGSEFGTDLDNIATKYGFEHQELDQMHEEDEDIFRYETIGGDGAKFPFACVVWRGDEVITWARADNATERATMDLIFGIKQDHANFNLLIRKVNAYIDAAKRTFTRAVRNQTFTDCRYKSSSLGQTFSDDSALIQFVTVTFEVDYWTSTETTA